MATTLTTEHNHTGDNSTTTYSVTFPYLKEADVKVTLDHVLTTAYTFTNATTLVFNTAPATGVKIRIFRDTDVDAARFVFSSGSALKAGEINENLDQLLFADQERASTDNIADEAVTTAKLRDGSVTQDKLGANAIITTSVADGAVTTVKLADNSVTEPKIADGAVTSSKYAAQSVGTAALADGSVTEPKLATDSVSTTKIVNDAVTMAKLGSGALPTDITVASANIVDGTIATADIAADAITNALIATDAVNADSVQDGTLDSAKLTADTVVTAAEHAASTPDDTSFFTTSASDSRYFRQDSTETVTSGVSWTSDNARVATTGAIDARIVDLVEEVGGFVPIANETSFPAANPDVNNGTGTIVSVGAIGTSRTPSAGTVTITDGAGTGNDVAITGVGTQVLTAGFGMLVETTTTLHTYTFHRLTAPATNVNTVATNISGVNTVAGIDTDVTTVASNNANVTTVATDIANVNSVGGSIANVNTAATNIADINTVAADLNEATSEIDTVATNIANVNAVGTDITNVNTVASNINSVNSFSDVYRIAASDPTTSLDVGDLCFNTTNNALRVYTGTSWVNGVTAAGDFMSRTGDAMTGNLNMQNNKVENLANATAAGDAVSKSVMDTAIDTALTTDVVGGQSITVTDNSPASGQISVSVTGASIGSTQLDTTGVTAGSYGSSSAIPSITVDANGRVTAASTSSIDSTSISNGTSNVSVASGADITVTRGGNLTTTFNANGALFPDNKSVAVGNSNDIEITHDGTDSFINCNNGDFHLTQVSPSKLFNLRAIDGNSTIGDYVTIDAANAQVLLKVHGSTKATVSNSGLSVTGALSSQQFTCGPNQADFQGGAIFGDNKELVFGSGSGDSRIYSDGSLTRWKGDAGELRITQHSQGDDVSIRTDNGSGTQEYQIRCDGTSRNVSLYYQGASKLNTYNLGVNVTGFVDCDNLDVSSTSVFGSTAQFNGGSNAISLPGNSDIRATTGTLTAEPPNNVGKIQYASNDWYIQSQGNWRFRNGSATNVVVIDSSGNLTANGNVTAFSDVNLKKDIETIPHALDKVLGMRGVNFTVKESGVRSTGVIAQEIEEQLPEVVMTNEDGVKSVAYGNVVGVLIEAIKELKAEIDELKGGK